MQLRSGYLVGRGATINVETGWVPDMVILSNLTDGDLITIGFLGGESNTRIVPFSGGGTIEIVPGMIITGVTSKARGEIDQVLLASGAWAGGDAAGFFVVKNIKGTFSGENVTVPGGSADDATVTAAVEHTIAIALAAATATGTSAITQYIGAQPSSAKGFTIGSVIAEAGKLLKWTAFRNDD